MILKSSTINKRGDDLMKFTFQKLTQTHAIEIADRWNYEGEYAFYDMTADIKDYEEFIHEQTRNENDCFEAIFNNELLGYFCVIQNGTELEISLGLKPNLCGNGIGKEFLTQIIEFIDENYEYEKLVLSVASFNQLAMKVYHACGFKDKKVFMQDTNGDQYEFIRMVKSR